MGVVDGVVKQPNWIGPGTGRASGISRTGTSMESIPRHPRHPSMESIHKHRKASMESIHGHRKSSTGPGNAPSKTSRQQYADFPGFGLNQPDHQKEQDQILCVNKDNQVTESLINSTIVNHKVPWYKGNKWCLNENEIIKFIPTFVILVGGLVFMMIVIPYAFASVIRHNKYVEMLNSGLLAVNKSAQDNAN